MNFRDKTTWGVALFMVAAITIIFIGSAAAEKQKRPNEELRRICYGAHLNTPVKDVPAQCLRVFLLENNPKSIDNK